MANRIVSLHAGIYGIGIYAITLPSSGFSVAHLMLTNQIDTKAEYQGVSECNPMFPIV